MTASMQALVVEMSGFQRDLLRSVAQVGPACGSAISKDLEALRSNVTVGGLYPNLDALDAMGLIEKDPTAIDERSNQYAMTERGWDVLAFFNGAYADAVERERQEVPA